MSHGKTSISHGKTSVYISRQNFNFSLNCPRQKLQAWSSLTGVVLAPQTGTGCDVTIGNAGVSGSFGASDPIGVSDCDVTSGDQSEGIGPGYGGEGEGFGT